MKRKRTLKTLLVLSMFGIFTDRCAPIITAEILPYTYSPIKDDENKEDFGALEYISMFKLPHEKKFKKMHEFRRDSDLGALEYLVLAHSISFNTISYENDCKGYSLETFNTYKKLITEDNRPDLADKVRFALGHVTVENRKGMHAWTEVNLDGEWQPYETTNIIDCIGNNQYLRYVTRTSDMTEGFSDYYPITTMQANQSVARINFRWFYQKPGGLAEFYGALKDLAKASYTKADEFFNGEKKTEK